MKQLPLFLAAMALALAPLAFVHPVRIQGVSMQPTLRDGEIRFALRSWCAPGPRIGEIWVVRSPEGGAVKRILALPGQRLALRDGKFCRDGLSIEESYVLHPESGSAGPWEAGSGYLVLGDNRPASRDGRAWGALPRTDLESVIIY
ncbi:signal peptidase I [Holophaga foetida]|uniref:signal peptidase I n=1 Tax=Holophaga foetida TaxID=35839 RepID=UPI0002472ADD|nr:signal peptidase I [Holophaga foetida]